MTEDIINALTAIAELQVIGRTSMFALEPGMQGFARDRRAPWRPATIVEGSVRKAGEMLRVSGEDYRFRNTPDTKMVTQVVRSARRRMYL